MRVSKHLAAVSVLSLALAAMVIAAPTNKVLADAGDFVKIISTGPSNTNCGTPIHGDVTVSINFQDFVQTTDELDLTDASGAVKQVLEQETILYSGSGTGSNPLYGFSVNTTVPEGSWLKFRVTSDDLSGGVFTTFVRWQCFGKSMPDPHLPPNFVLRPISCNTALYWAADPKATINTGDRITAGQVWYVNPTAVKGTDGNQWSPVFVGSLQLVYIPTSCAFQTQVVVNSAPPANAATSSGGAFAYAFPTGLHQ